MMKYQEIAVKLANSDSICISTRRGPEIHIDRLAQAIMKTLENEREECAKIADAIDSGRGNEKEIANAIRSRE